MKNRNNTFTILSALAMLLVILGHLNFGCLSFCGLFPYYSFHVMIFVFISGYFYKSVSEDNILQYIWHKTKTLLLPYFAYNLIYGIVATILHKYGFEIGGELSIYNLFVAPFVGGHQYMYNATAWFVPALFMLEVCNVIGRKTLSFFKIKDEWIIFVLYLFIGMFTVFMAKRGSVYDYYKIPGRIMLMAPCFGMGRIYREKLEKYDIMPSSLLIILLFIMNLILTKTHGGLAYSVVWVTGFANTIATPFITALTGIWLWLRIAKVIDVLTADRSGIAKHIRNALLYFGQNTYTVMMHQLIVFMGIKEVFFVLYKNGNKLVSDFDQVLYHSDVYYTYVPSGVEWVKIVYVVLGILLPLSCKWIVDRVLEKQRHEK